MDTTSSSPNFGLQLKLARVASGKRQRDVADALGVTRATIGAWETNQRRVTLVDAHRYATAVDQDLITVLER